MGELLDLYHTSDKRKSRLDRRVTPSDEIVDVQTKSDRRKKKDDRRNLS